VSTKDKLEMVLPEFRSEDPKRPLAFMDKDGTQYTHKLNRMWSCVLLIFIVEAIQQFSYQGVKVTQTAYLTGQYNQEWNAGMAGVDVASLDNLSTAIAYSLPVIGAILADYFIG